MPESVHVRLWNLGAHVCIEVDQLKEEIRMKMINMAHTIINLHVDLFHYKTCYNCPKAAVIERKIARVVKIRRLRVPAVTGLRGEES